MYWFKVFDYVPNIDDFRSLGATWVLVVYGDEVGMYLKVSKRSVVVHGDVVSFFI